MTPMLTVRSLLDEGSGLRLVLLAGESGLGRRITIHRIQKPGLALAGFVRQVHPERVQVLGRDGDLVPADAVRRGGAPVGRLVHGPQPGLRRRDQGAGRAAHAARRRRSRGRAAAAHAAGVVAGHRRHPEAPRAAAGAHRQHPRGAHGRARRRRPAARQERHRQVGGGARPHHARPPPGRRRPGRGAAHVGRRAGGLGLRSSSSTTWRCAASASSTSRTCSASRPCATRRRSSWCSSCCAGTRPRATIAWASTRWSTPSSRCRCRCCAFPVSPGRNVSSLIEVAARNRLLQVRGHHSAREFQERLDRALADARERALAGRRRMRLVVVTGVSGAGKSTALRALEDLGYYCADNLPLPLLPKFVELLSTRAEIDRAALGIDARGGEFLQDARPRSSPTSAPPGTRWRCCSSTPATRSSSGASPRRAAGTRCPTPTSAAGLVAERDQLAACCARRPTPWSTPAR